MVTAVAPFPLFPSLPSQDEMFPGLSEEDRTELADIGQKFLDFISPLAKVRAQDELVSLLPQVANQVSNLRYRATDILEASAPSPRDLLAQVSRVHDYFREQAQTKRDLLGDEPLDSVLGALESADGLNQWIVERLQEGQGGIYRVVNVVERISPHIIYADLAISTVGVILLDAITNWEPEALPLLCQAADDSMTEVEDIFLTRTGLDIEAEQVLDYASVSESLGL